MSGTRTIVTQEVSGTFNGVRLRRITSITTEAVNGSKRTTIQVLDFPHRELEAKLQSQVSAILILSDREIEGRIVSYSANRHGYEIVMKA
jgi:hypothetical protein